MFKKNIVILGAGFAGVRTAIELAKRAKELDFRITLIDKNNYHTFTLSLYEVATCEEPKKNAVIPLKEIFGNKVHIVKGEVQVINVRDKFVRLKDKSIFYFDYLVIALGSEPSYFGIQGLTEYSLCLKTLSDALVIQKEIKKIYHKKEKHELVNIVVGGGGFAGVELAAEFLCYRERLAKEFFCKDDCMKVSVIQGSERLLKELDKEASNAAQKRLEEYGVKLCLGEHIKTVTSHHVKTDIGNSYNYDLFIWTGGVRAVSILAQNGFQTNAKGQLIVNNYLQVVGYENIFAVGDNTEFIDVKTKQHAPWVVPVAEDQGKIAAENIVRLIQKTPLEEYKLSHLGYVVPLKGRFAILELKSFHVFGFFGWVVQQIILLKYLLGILSFAKAFKRWSKFEHDLTQK